MRNLIVAFIVVILCGIVGNNSSAAAQEKKKLCFNNKGTFKIVQFTDDHVVWQDHRSDAAFTCISKIIKAEKPDFVILTGDIIFGGEGVQNFKHVISYVDSFHIPFAFVFGNHDRQFGASNGELREVVKDLPYNYTRTAADVPGDCNFDLPIYSRDKQKTAAVLYGIDSNSDVDVFKRTGVKGYDYILRDQIEWYARTSSRYKEENGGTPLPALAFFHIPLQEFALALHTPGVRYYGIQAEDVCCPPLNSGLFTVMKEQGDVMGVFCGHDHVNDYAADYYGILLAYGRYSGGSTVYNDNKTNGGRVIVLTEGQRTIRTWISLSDGTKRQDTKFPQDYIVK